MKTTTKNTFYGYEKLVADNHLRYWGVIYLDEYDLPMEVEDVIYMLESGGR